MKKTYNLVELFSGIGSQAKALKNLGAKLDFDVNTIGTCEWDIQALCAYDAIHKETTVSEKNSKLTKEEIYNELKDFTLSNDGKQPMDKKMLHTYSKEILARILTAKERCNNFIDVSSLTGDCIPNDIDILTYSFPCQDLSNVGAFHGYNKGIDKDSGSRSSLLWQVGRILTEMKTENKKLPRYLLMENVPALLAKRHKSNFEEWISVLQELGYYSKYFLLNAFDFGLPQNRPRLLMLSVFVGDNPEKNTLVGNFFSNKTADDLIKEYNDYKKSNGIKDVTLYQMLRTDYTNETYRSEALQCNPNATPSRLKIWEDNPQYIIKNYEIPKDDKNKDIHDRIRTITTKQDRNPNSGNLFFDLGGEGKSTFRYLTPRECLLFMGFTEEDYENIIRNNPTHHNTTLFPRDKIIRMAGNSIPVKLLEGIFYQIKLLDDKLTENGCT